MRTWARGLLALAMLAPHLVSVSCASAGDEDTLSLSDAAGGGCAGPDSLAVPIALGARLAVKVADQNVTPPIAQAESSDPAVVLVESVANPVLLRAASPGTATLEVWDSAQSTGSTSLIVTEVASVVTRLDELLVFNLDIALRSPFTTTATAILGAGVALLPDGVLRVTPVFMDAAGTELIGHDLASWSATPAALSWTYPDPYSDAIDVQSNGTVEGPVTLTEAGGSALTVTLLPSGGASSLEPYWPETGALGGALTLAVGEVRTVVGVLRGSGGHLVVGDDGASFVAEPTGENITVVAPPWSEGEEGVEVTPEIAALLVRVRATWVEGVHAGTTELLISAAGQSVTIPVTITE